ncbi:MAG: carboxylating nicotinate-nucleotide diphosphorylase, partial [Armatimonadetes bacterium]|nr:carboxylating nicotinate-nucleotide diphosphorylase [Armatimonadota bacterium]
KVVEQTVRARGVIETSSPGVLAGMPVVEEVMRQVDNTVNLRPLFAEGAAIVPGDALAIIEGSARSILTAERVALNFLQRLSGIATLTARFVEAVSGARARITDTRKTTPGLRMLQRYAVRAGGGSNHRMCLSDAILIKDNHIVAAGGITRAVARARAAASHTTTVTVECETLEQVAEAIEAGADILLLDNMTDERRSQAVSLVAGRAVTEASGGISLETVAAVAATGVDCISVGALTHSAQSLDMRLELSLMEG